MKKVLVVGDALSFRLLACLLLKKAGYQPVALDNAIAALAYLETSPVDLIIIDMALTRMSGTELIGLIRKLPYHKAVPIIGMSAGVYHSKSNTAGVNTFVDKMRIDWMLVSEVNRLLKAAG